MKLHLPRKSLATMLKPSGIAFPMTCLA